MKKIVKIDSNISSDFLRIELFLSNVCNYSCWYCFPGYHEGDSKWPKLETIVDNLSFVIEYYKRTLQKKKINLHIIGGEPTLWKDFGEFVKYFKETHDCIISISSNGSRTLRWWEEYGHFIDHVMLSCHHERVDPNHIKEVADLLYTKDVTVNGMVLMDPLHWEKCKDIVESLKSSNYYWPITCVEVHHNTLSYTPEQKKYLRKSIKRYPEINYWLRCEKLPRAKPTVYYNDNTFETVERNWLSLNKKNYFAGWECDIGIDTFLIDKNGNIRGGCGETLYNLDYHFNIYDDDFLEKFNLKIVPTICKRTGVCDCQPETNSRKRYLESSKNFIPIISV